MMLKLQRRGAPHSARLPRGAALCLALAVASSVGSGGCNRVEEPPASRTGPRSPSDDSATIALPSEAGGQDARPPAASTAPGQGQRLGCRAPWPQEPAPKAVPAESCPDDPGPVPLLPTATVEFPELDRPTTLRVEVARTPGHRARGLMYRTTLGESSGMLFEWPTAAPRSFWMRNTCIPLDMVFIASDSTVAGILEQVPPLNEAPRAVPCPAKYVLEVAAGWARRHGLAPGQRLRIAP